MAIVVEKINRSGQALQTQVFAQSSVSIGRGFDCDVILSDSHVDRLHLRVEQNPATGRFSCVDMKSLNGAWMLPAGRSDGVKKKTRVSGRHPFYSGQTFALGRTLVRVYSSDHHIPETEAMSRWEEVGQALSLWWVCLLLAMILGGLEMWDSYLTDPRVDSLLEHGLKAVYAVAGAALFAGIWSLLGRSLRHDGKFPVHWNVAMLGMIVFNVTGWGLSIAVFNLNMWPVAEALTTLLMAAILYYVIYVSLIFSTQLRMHARTGIAAAIPVLILVIPLLVESVKKAEFDPMPPYNRALVTPGWQLRDDVTLEAFMTGTRSLYGDLPKNQATGTEE